MSKILVAYIPVLHAGYVALLKKYPHPLYILGKDLMLEFPRMEREVRLLAPEDMKKAIEGLGVVSEVMVLEKKDIGSISEDFEIIMPDEDLMHYIANTYFIKNKVFFEKVFLRWDKPITMRENIVEPNKVISREEFDRDMIKLAFEVADKSSDWWRQVGAVAVKDDKVLFARYNRHLPSAHTLYENGDPRNNFDAGEHLDLYTSIHAEAGIIAEAAKNGVSLDGATMYVTTFPCPVCAKSIVEAGVRKVFYSKGYSLVDAEKLFNQYGVEIVLVQ